MSDEERDRAFAALVSICRRHQPDRAVQFDPDCGDCGSRQEAAAIWLVGLVEDVAKALGVSGCRACGAADHPSGCADDLPNLLGGAQ